LQTLTSGGGDSAEAAFLQNEALHIRNWVRVDGETAIRGLS